MQNISLNQFNRCVSVILPTYNRGALITDALESVRRQTSFRLVKQIIVINDGSTDNTIEIITQYMLTHPEMPIKIINQANLGVSSARNTGMKVANGKWIAFLDSDDEWVSNKLERQFEVIFKNPYIDFLGTGYDDTELWILWKHIRTLYRVNYRDILIKCFPVTPSIVMKKTIFENIGGFEETSKYAEDLQYWMKICRLNYNVYYLPESLVKTGHGKPLIGDSGLTANLQKMQDGQMRNIRELYEINAISKLEYGILRVFHYLKYLRRIIIVKSR